MVALVTALTVVVVLLTVLVLGLLRSHADILKALHDLGADVDIDGVGHAHSGSNSGQVAFSAPVRRTDRRGADLVGTTPDGDAVAVSVTGPDDTLLAFLSTGCTSCAPIWESLRAEPVRGPNGARVVVVTRGDDLESPSRVAEMAAGVGVPVVRSSEAWDAYQVPGAPYAVFVEGGSGRIRGEGTARGWDQVVALAERAVADEGERRSDDELDRDAEARRRLAALASDRAREARADAELSAAGIGPGDPRLYLTPEESDAGAEHPEGVER